MIIGTVTEPGDGESRVALTPDSVKRLRHLGANVEIESGAGNRSGYSDADYEQAGAEIQGDRHELLGKANLMLQVQPPTVDDLHRRRDRGIQIGFLNLFEAHPRVTEMAERNLSGISMELIPRITRAQKMDALSSQANLAGYVSVIVAAERLNKIFPMMMTAAGTIAPARVFVIGAGVAGLQAIATAKRLGARVDAYDTRPEVEEQVKSVGGRFVKIDLGETGQTKDGYAKALSEEQIRQQRETMKEICAQADVVITTAQVFGRRAPVLVTEPMLEAMKPGSVVVDLAVESGGNVEGIVRDEVVDRNGVQLVGYANLPGRVPAHASQMYAANLVALIEEFWNADTRTFVIDPSDEIMKSCLITHEGDIVNERFKNL